MNLRSLLSTIVLLGFGAHVAYGQCEITASVSPGTTVCGDCAELSTFGQGQGQQVFNEDFNSGSPSGWAFTQQADFTNPCSPGGANGTTHIWMGANSGVPRALETVTYDFTTATAGVTVCFDMLFAEQGGSAPCEGPDEPDEGVSLQYSPDGGSTWIEVDYFDPNGGNDPDLVNWNNWCVQLPPAAIGPTTRIRWFQDNDSGADYDHWGIDNVEVYYNDPTYQITWQHDNYSYPVGSSGGVNPNQVCPQNQTDYIVIMTNGTYSCTDTVTLNVSSPTIEVDAGNDTTICPSTCAVLDGTAKVIKKPAKTPTYENNEFEVIATGLGQSTEININVTDLNMTTILPGSITEVCINNLTFFGFNIFPPGQQTIGDLSVNLICPDGTVITLVPNGVTTNSSPLQGYSQTCFTPVSTTNIGSSSEPYTGSFQPDDPFNDLVGCTANGVWAMEVVAASPLSFGTGTFFGWSISFDDPEISYVADVSWTPTTNMIGANTLNPTVCPTTSTTYTLTATDTAGCVTVTDTVRVNVQPCCNLEYNSSSIDPTCGNNDGYIQINVTSGSGNYSYQWGGGGTTNSLSNIGPGTYTVTITDNGQANCVKDTSITLTSTTGPVIDSVTTTPETCLGDGDGTVTVYATGSSLTYQWDDPNNSTTANVTNLAPGTYNVTVTDGAGCTSTSSIAVLAGPDCCTFQLSLSKVDPTCAGNNGSITTTVTAGSGNYSYLWGGGQTTPNLIAVGSGFYTVTVTDLDVNNCTRVDTITLSAANGPGISGGGQITEPCLGDNTGSVFVDAYGGTAPLSYLWNDPNNSTTDTVSNLAPGSYTVTVTDGAGCQATFSTTLSAGPPCCNLDVDFSYTHPTCAGLDGEVTFTILQGSGNYGYLWNGPYVSGTPFYSSLYAGTYNFTIIDSSAFGCEFDTTFTLTAPNAPVIDSVTSVTELCLGDNDGSVTVYATSNNGAPLTILWDDPNNSTTATVNNLAPGTYNVTVTDTSGCSATSSISLAAGPPCCNLDFTASTTPPTCGANDGEILVTVTQGSGNYTYNWTPSGLSGNNPTGLASGSYTVTIIDNGQTNCQRDTTINLSSIGAPVIDSIIGTDEACFGIGDGTATVYASGGVTPYTYAWSNSQTNQTTSNLIAGNYTVTVTDAASCQAVGSVTIVSPSELQYSAIVTQPSCNNNDGTIDGTITGGTAPYAYNWDDNLGGIYTTEDLNGLAGGTYDVTITDNAGCSFDTSFVLSAAAAPIVTATPTNESCLGFNNGSVTANVTGGNGPFTFVWSTGSTAASINAGAGTYWVVVTDASGCTDSDTATVLAGPLCCQLNASGVDEPAYCGQSNGALTIVVDSTTGPAPYTYALDGGATVTTNQFNNLLGGLHTIVVTDVNGCLDTLVASVTEIQNDLTLTINANSPTCAEGNDGDAAALAQGGTLPYTYNWNNGDTGFQTTTLPVGQYSVVVTDGNGCSITESTLLSTDPVLADLIQDEDLCEGTSLTFDAGSASSYNWSTGDDGQTITVTDTGMYFVTITDIDGCEITDTVQVNFHPGFVVDAGLDTSIEFATSTDLEAEVSIADSNGAYSWSPDFFLSCNDCALTMATPDTTTLFYVSYTSEQGCIATDSVLVEVQEEPYVAVMPSAFSPNGDGENDILYLYHSGTTDVYWIIFDRWGEKVFETRDPDQGWDGTYKGKILAPGTFVHHFYVEFKNSTSKRASGSTTLLR